MRNLIALLLGLLASTLVLPADRYLELRANANAYAEPDRTSDIEAKLKFKGGNEPHLLRQVKPQSENGYYRIELPGQSGKYGWVYKSYVRGYAGGAESLALLRDGRRGSNEYGACKEVFATGKPPIAPDDVTPLCEESDGIVFFASGYSKQDNHGYWSAYKLDEEKIDEMNENPKDRPQIQFRKNPQLNDGDYVQPQHKSYTHTDWDRGHLAPNGAMAWDEDAQRRSFMISNIAPQKPGMNRNIWRCFEYSIREWAASSGDTYVVVGTTRGKQVISGDTDPNEVEINVPSHYVAMVYRTKPEPTAIGVMVPNTAGNLDIRKFMMSVAELESKSGFQFKLPASVAEQSPNLKRWPTRIVKRELLGKLPAIDVQCPRVN